MDRELSQMESDSDEELSQREEMTARNRYQQQVMTVQEISQWEARRSQEFYQCQVHVRVQEVSQYCSETHQELCEWEETTRVQELHQWEEDGEIYQEVLQWEECVTTQEILQLEIDMSEQQELEWEEDERSHELSLRRHASVPEDSQRDDIQELDQREGGRYQDISSWEDVRSHTSQWDNAQEMSQRADERQQDLSPRENVHSHISRDDIQEPSQREGERYEKLSPSEQEVRSHDSQLKDSREAELSKVRDSNVNKLSKRPDAGCQELPQGADMSDRKLSTQEERESSQELSQSRHDISSKIQERPLQPLRSKEAEPCPLVGTSSPSPEGTGLAAEAAPALPSTSPVLGSALEAKLIGAALSRADEEKELPEPLTPEEVNTAASVVSEEVPSAGTQSPPCVPFDSMTSSHASAGQDQNITEESVILEVMEMYKLRQKLEGEYNVQQWMAVEETQPSSPSPVTVEVEIETSPDLPSASPVLGSPIHLIEEKVRHKLEVDYEVQQWMAAEETQPRTPSPEGTEVAAEAVLALPIISPVPGSTMEAKPAAAALFRTDEEELPEPLTAEEVNEATPVISEKVPSAETQSPPCVPSDTPTSSQASDWQDQNITDQLLVLELVEVYEFWQKLEGEYNLQQWMAVEETQPSSHILVVTDVVVEAVPTPPITSPDTSSSSEAKLAAAALSRADEVEELLELLTSEEVKAATPSVISEEMPSAGTQSPPCVHFGTPTCCYSSARQDQNITKEFLMEGLVLYHHPSQKLEEEYDVQQWMAVEETQPRSHSPGVMEVTTEAVAALSKVYEEELPELLTPEEEKAAASSVISEELPSAGTQSPPWVPFETLTSSQASAWQDQNITEEFMSLDLMEVYKQRQKLEGEYGLHQWMAVEEAQPSSPSFNGIEVAAEAVPALPIYSPVTSSPTEAELAAAVLSRADGVEELPELLPPEEVNAAASSVFSEEVPSAGTLRPPCVLFDTMTCSHYSAWQDQNITEEILLLSLVMFHHLRQNQEEEYDLQIRVAVEETQPSSISHVAVDVAVNAAPALPSTFPALDSVIYSEPGAAALFRTDEEEEPPELFAPDKPIFSMPGSEHHRGDHDPGNDRGLQIEAEGGGRVRHPTMDCYGRNTGQLFWPCGHVSGSTGNSPVLGYPTESEPTGAALSRSAEEEEVSEPLTPEQVKELMGAPSVVSEELPSGGTQSPHSVLGAQGPVVKKSIPPFWKGSNK
ncbi:uncharacterized protein LOC111929170 [Cyanistes caeruleus]|uniref:uncharacterized protein LOC111929170 n=1 Tax=Cyanistes caeruleus TaxID=156563 RepID=UPI000CDB4A2C|nr:uncharacterized protein LOC111929170 [Cyanistes caeruleus]